MLLNNGWYVWIANPNIRRHRMQIRCKGVAAELLMVAGPVGKKGSKK